MDIDGHVIYQHLDDEIAPRDRQAGNFDSRIETGKVGAKYGEHPATATSSRTMQSRVGVVDEDSVFEARFKEKLEGVNMCGVAKLSFLKTRHRLLGEQLVDEKMPILFDAVGVHRENTDIAPWSRGRGKFRSEWLNTRYHRDFSINSSKLQNRRVHWAETVELLKNLECVKKVALPLYFSPLPHAVSIHLGSQKSKEGIRM